MCRNPGDIDAHNRSSFIRRDHSMSIMNRGCFQGSAPTDGHHMDTSDDNDKLNKNCGL